MYGFNPYQQNYQPNYQNNYGSIPQQNNIMPQTNNSQDERIWVQNETSAEAYLLAPNGFVRLWDSSSNRFYEKRADANGRPLPMDIYEYKRVTLQSAENESRIATDEINERIDSLAQRIEELEKAKKGASRNAKQSDATNADA